MFLWTTYCTGTRGEKDTSALTYYPVLEHELKRSSHCCSECFQHLPPRDCPALVVKVVRVVLNLKRIPADTAEALVKVFSFVFFPRLKTSTFYILKETFEFGVSQNKIMKVAGFLVNIQIHHYPLNINSFFSLIPVSLIIKWCSSWIIQEQVKH